MMVSRREKRRSKRLNPEFLRIKSVILKLRRKRDELAAWQKILGDIWLDDDRRNDMPQDLRTLLLSDLRWDLGNAIGYLEGCAKLLEEALEDLDGT